MPVLRKNAAKLPLVAWESGRVTPFGGLLLLEALCRRCNLWDQINGAAIPSIDSPSLGRRPAETAIAQLIVSLAMGSAGLAEAAMLREDPLLLRLLGLKKAADEVTLEKWLMAQNEISLKELRRINAAFVQWALAQVMPARTGERRRPIDIVMRTKHFYFSRISRSVSDHGLDLVGSSWRTVAVGPFLLDGLWSSDSTSTEVTAQLTELLGVHGSVWKDYEAYFSSDVHSDPSRWNGAMTAAGFSLWTVEVDDCIVRNACGFDPDSGRVPWEQADENDTFAQAYHLARPKVDQRPALPGVVAIARRKREGSDMESFACLIGPTVSSAPLQTWFKRHFQVELVMDQMVDCLHLARAIPLEGNARAAYFVIASLAHNLLTGLRLLLKPDAPHWNTSETIRRIIMVPAALSSSGHEDTLNLAVPSDSATRWIEFVSQSMPNLRSDSH